MSHEQTNSQEQFSRSYSPISRSEVRYDSRLQMLRSSQSPQKEHLNMEVAKLKDNSKKMLQMIDQMTKREEERSKQIYSQNQIISDLKQKLLAQISGQSDEIENTKESQFFISLLDELRAKQEEIDVINARTQQLEQTLQNLHPSRSLSSHSTSPNRTLQQTPSSHSSENYLEQYQQVDLNRQQLEKIQYNVQQMNYTMNTIQEKLSNVNKLSVSHNQVQQLESQVNQTVLKSNAKIEELEHKVENVVKNLVEIAKNQPSTLSASSLSNVSSQSSSHLSEEQDKLLKKVQQVDQQLGEVKSEVSTLKKELENVEHKNKPKKGEEEPEGMNYAQIGKEVVTLVLISAFFCGLKQAIQLI